MHLRTTLAPVLGVALSAMSPFLLAAPAGAQVLDAGSFVDTLEETVQHFCDSHGLRVHIETTATIRFQVKSTGADDTLYYAEHVALVRSYTNVRTGATATEVETTLSKDLDVVDNGDGTSTVLVLATGNSTLYGADGSPIARNPGQSRFEVLVDNGGTVSDPADDEFLAFLGVVKESTGRTDDYCAALVAELS